jgi:hypothetical protein
MCTRGKYLQNTLIKQQLENENNKILYKKVIMKYHVSPLLIRNLQQSVPVAVTPQDSLESDSTKY